MRKWIHALSLMSALGAAFPSVATPMTGADGLFAPATDYTLPYRVDGLFDFTAIDIGAGITVRFDTQMQNVTLLSLGDILIAGVIDASGIELALETPGQIVLTGSISADSISLTANSVRLTAVSSIMLTGGDLGVGGGTRGGNLCLNIEGCGLLSPPLGRLPLPPGAQQVLHGGDITLRAPTAITLAVPEPATPWLVALLLPLLAWFGCKRT